MIKTQIKLTLLFIFSIFQINSINAQSFDTELYDVINGNLDKSISGDGFGYSYSNLQTDLAIWKQNPNIKVDTIGYSVQNRAIIRLHFEKNAIAKSVKQRVSIHARTHPNEVQSTYVTNEIINILTSGSELADLLLDNLVFDIVPMYNPDGVELGLARYNANNIDIESNWSNISPQPEVVALKNSFQKIMQSDFPFRIALNMHSAYDCSRYFVYHHENGSSMAYSEEEKNFISAIQSFAPGQFQDWNYFVSWTSSTPTQYPESWFWNNYKDTVMALTYEDMNCSSAGDYYNTANAMLNGVAKYLGIVLSVESNFVSENSINVFPNPIKSNENLNIEFKNSDFKPEIIEISDIQGRIVFSQNMNVFDNEISFKIPTLNTGIYILSFKKENKIERLKLIVE